MKTIELSNGKTTTVDDCHYQQLAQYNWHQHNSGAVVRYENGTTIMMHREILEAPGEAKVKHRDGDKLNNTVENLEFIMRQDKPRENAAYSTSQSGLLGVSWNDRLQKWHAQFNLNFQRQSRYFDCPIEAAEFYDAMARKHLGDNARTNDVAELTPEHLERLELAKC
jgi:hypothetical protein